jgi:hypothetical protein
MTALSPAAVLDIWELGCRLHPIDRALLILSRAYPDYSHDELQDMCLGRRDELLLQARERTFGAGIEAVTACPICGYDLEFRTERRSLISETALYPAKQQAIAIDGTVFSLRSPNSRDAAAAAVCDDVESATQAIVDRCTAAVSEPHQRLILAGLPERTVFDVQQAFASLDPQSEILFALHCPGCGHEWQALFDIASFFWAEIRSQARRLLQEVDALARTYGWREADILRMSEKRRSLYLTMAMQ